MNWPRGLDLYWQHKISWSGVLIIAGIAKVREKKGDHISDAIVIASTTIAVVAIWNPEIRATIVGAAMASPLAPAVAVAVSAYAIGGVISFVAAEEGEEAQALVDYYHDPIGTTADIIVREVTDPMIEYVTEEIWQKQLVEPIGGWLYRRERDLRRAWEITRPRVPTWL